MNDEIRALESQIEELKRRLGDARRRAHADERIGEYSFRTEDGAPLRLADLFGDKPDLLIVHNMGQRCSYCTMWADGFGGIHKHLEDRAAFVLASPDEPAVMKEFARSRGWKFRTVSTAGSTFNKDMGFADPESGGVWPGVSAFHRLDDGAVIRTGSAQFGPGDNFCSVWHMLDLLRDGAAGWEPKYAY